MPAQQRRWRGLAGAVRSSAVWYGSCARDDSCDTRSSSPREWRRLPIGAELAPSGGVHFRLWAPRVAQVEVEVDGQRIRLETEPGGYHSGLAPAIRAGARYAYHLDGGPPLPDPASRFQPDGPHGPSEVIDPEAFDWTDTRWPGVPREGQVLYEMHVGTFTTAGTWRGRRPGAAGAGAGGHHRRGGAARRGLRGRLRLGI